MLALVGERGREVSELIEHDLGPDGLARSVVVVATSDEPALMRMQAALTATRIAEWFRDHGRHVVLMMDSLTRFCMAQREVGLRRPASPRPPGATRLRSSPSCPICSSAPVRANGAALPGCTPCSSRATT